jgi:hypothetical protein
MKLYLNKNQRSILLEILRASENNAIGGNDHDLAGAFAELYKTIEPTNAAYINLKRPDAETIVEFSEFVKMSLDKTIKFIDSDTSKSEEEREDLRHEATAAREEIDAIITQLQDKIKQNPV